ncbi:MAG: cobalamin biosynthesis protein CobW [Rhizobiales bacterium]|nr:cobalamin biosynthesis protein CobW [Hyphomicrobiales bacterium]
MRREFLMPHKIPVTVITGFLGAGKTTLIRNLIESANGKRLALIINEFGDVGVDGEVLKSCGDENCTEEDIVELANGCICCTVAEDFIPTMEKLLSRDERPDHIIIETSGLALPQPLVRAFNWPEIKTEVTVDGVITLVDAPAVSEGRFASNEAQVQSQRELDDALDHETPLGELFEDQVNCADLIVLSKTDLIDDQAVTAVKNVVSKEVRDGVQMVQAQKGKLPLNVLLGLDMKAEDDNRMSHHERHHAAHHHDDDHHDHDHHHHHTHDHDDFESFSIGFETIDDVESFKSKLIETIKTHDILRLKGFVSVKDKDMRLQIQAVGPRLDAYYDKPWNLDETRNSNLVVIGQAGMDRDAIQQGL